MGPLQTEIEHQRTTFKHLNCDTQKNTLGACPPRTSSCEDHRSHPYILNLSFAWKGYFLGLYFAIKSGGGFDLVFSVKETARVFTTSLSARKVCFKFHERKLHFAIGMNNAWITAVFRYILAILIGVSKERDCLHFTNQK